jgi:uncharacterized alkaline shock family protein YloU
MVSRQIPRAVSNTDRARDITPEEVTLRPEVVAKIAAMAARDVDGVALGAMPGVLALLLGASPDAVTRVRRAARARLDGTRAIVDLWLKVDYGPPIAKTVGAVRQAVRKRMHDLAQVEDVHVNVHVTDLVLPSDAEEASEG